MSSFSSTSAEIAHVQLRSCLVNLPPSLAEAVVTAGTPAQNLIVELQLPASASARADSGSSLPRSVYVGWTGLSSRRRPQAPYPTDAGSPRSNKSTNFVEIDSAFARVLDLPEGQKVSVVLRTEPELVHTLNVEPLTSGDWEMIELHAAFLETNLQAQVRALPNPTFAGSKTTKANPHPLTLHLSPTSTANVIISSFSPAVASDVAFAKLAPDAEVIVAPKSRNRPGRTGNSSVTGVSQKSAGTRSGTGSSKARGSKSDAKHAIYLRAIAIDLLSQKQLEPLDTADLESPTIWVEESAIPENLPKWPEYILVSVVGSSTGRGAGSPEDLQKIQAQESGDAGKHSSKIAARLKRASRIPKSQHAIISASLGRAIGLKTNVGEVIRLDPAPPSLPRSSIKSLKIYPFQPETSALDKTLKIGGATRANKGGLVDEIRSQLGSRDRKSGLLSGPLTDGMIIRAGRVSSGVWTGGLLRFEPKPAQTDSKQPSARWLNDLKQELPIEIGEEVHNPLTIASAATAQNEALPKPTNVLIGLQKISDQVVASLSHQSSVLLEGGMGAGKTSIVSTIGRRLEVEQYCHVSYLDCRKLTTDETRVSTIKELFKGIFMEAWWGSQLGGQSVVIFDDLDKLCPAETELQVGGENARSRQISEIFSSVVHQYCTGASGISILATAIGKESLQGMLIGSHVVRDIISIKAPDKTLRRDILQALSLPPSAIDARHSEVENGHQNLMEHTNGTVQRGETSDEDDDADEEERAAFRIDSNVDFLDIAGQTDGYMPGDIVLLASRTRSEAIMRSIREDFQEQRITISKDDFTRALKGFIPVSLRNVTLQSSSTTFDSIGGLETTRKILLETLQYPTTYAPIFAQCPLRLRSGLLLYGYPGCGKTLLASAVAGECGLNFISVKGPEILNKYIGASEKSVRDLFERAESAKPCVLFFDEFDSIAPKRGHDSTGVTDRVVNQLLTEMDGAEGLSGVYVLAATSRPDLIDSALLRPGRLDKSLLCDMPDENDRLGILTALSKNLKMNASIRTPSQQPHKSLTEVARRTEGFSGADLQAVVYNAQLEAVHEVLAEHRPEQSTKKVTSKSRHVAQKDILAFRFGGHDKESNGTQQSSSQPYHHAQLGELAAMTAQLDALKLAKRKEKVIRRGQHDSESGRPEQNAGGPEPIIQWKHIEASLNTTRRSINNAERNKLERIYREFVDGRNGEMPTGQGSNEVGARSSLM